MDRVETASSMRPSRMQDRFVNRFGTLVESRTPSMMLPLVEPRSEYVIPSDPKRIKPCH